jgi:hypothetical protein
MRQTWRVKLLGETNALRTSLASWCPSSADANLGSRQDIHRDRADHQRFEQRQRSPIRLPLIVVAAKALNERVVNYTVLETNLSISRAGRIPDYRSAAVIRDRRCEIHLTSHGLCCLA